MTDWFDRRETCLACEGRTLAATELEGQSFSICGECGCVFANPTPRITWDSAGDYLREDIALEAAMAEVETCQSRIREIERFKSPGALLDISCGLGFLVKAAEKMGWRAAGCDMSEERCEFGRRVLGVSLFTCGYEDLPALSAIRHPDVITANHVLEHLASPSDFVRFAERTLAPEGLVVLEIPNLFSFESLNCAEAWQGLALPYHVAFYTPESLTRLFEPGFKVVHVEYSVSQYFHEKVATYMGRVAVDPKIIDRSARQFSGTSMVAYISRLSENGHHGAAARRMPMFDRAVREVALDAGHRERNECPTCQSKVFRDTELCGQPFSVCERCGCVFANPLPESFGEDSGGFYLRDQPTVEAALAEVEKCRVQIRGIARFKSRGSLLDIGCGLGYLVKAAEMEGWQAAGCDLSEACCEFGRRELGVDLFTGGFEELPDLSGIHTPDVITANHVLEHMVTPAEFVRFAEATLAPGGLAVVEVPNLFSFESLYRAESWHGLAIPQHVTFFTPESLNRLFAPHFRVKLVEYSVAQFFRDKVEGYLHRLTRDQGIIDRFAQQFTGTAMVAYIEKESALPFGVTGQRDGHALPYRAVRKVRRLFQQGRR